MQVPIPKCKNLDTSVASRIHFYSITSPLNLSKRMATTIKKKKKKYKPLRPAFAMHPSQSLVVQKFLHIFRGPGCAATLRLEIHPPHLWQVLEENHQKLPQDTD